MLDKRLANGSAPCLIGPKKTGRSPLSLTLILSSAFFIGLLVILSVTFGVFLEAFAMALASGLLRDLRRRRPPIDRLALRHRLGLGRHICRRSISLPRPLAPSLERAACNHRQRRPYHRSHHGKVCSSGRSGKADHL